MKLVPECFRDFFSDEYEDYLFGLGKYAPPPPKYTYDPKTNKVYDCCGCVIDTCNDEITFKKLYPGGVIHLY